MKCSICEGEGEFIDYMEDYVPAARYDCPACTGSGEMCLREWLSQWFWENVPVEFAEWYGERKWKDS